MDKQMPDTPWHIGYARKQEDDPKRHRARCIFYHKELKICQCRYSNYNHRTCGGSSHCSCYAESDEQWKRVWEKNRTIEQERAEQDQTAKDMANLYQKKMIRQREQKLLDDPFQFINKSVSALLECPICKERLINESNKTKKCLYCGAKFIDGVKGIQGPEGYFVLSVGRRSKRRKRPQ